MNKIKEVKEEENLFLLGFKKVPSLFEFTNEEKVGYLQWCCDKYGDFFVARANIEKWSKWRSVLECWHNEDGLKFLREVNNRTPFCNEVIFDLETGNFSALAIVLKSISKLGGEIFAYKSGGKGFHVHVLLDKPFNSDSIRREILLFFYKKFKQLFKIDVLKASSKSMIALEYTPHWRTGNIKQLLYYRTSQLYEVIESKIKRGKENGWRNGQMDKIN